MQSTKSVKYGFLAGVGAVAYILLFYFFSPRLMLSSVVLWSSLAIYLVAMWMAARRALEVGSELTPFREALKAAFTVFVVANLLYYCFYYLLFTVIDPGLIDLQRELLAERLEWIGNPQFQPKDLQVTLGNTFLSYCWSLIGGFLLAALTAALASRI